jgi:hypothetical protein
MKADSLPFRMSSTLVFGHRQEGQTQAMISVQASGQQALSALSFPRTKYI